MRHTPAPQPDGRAESWLCVSYLLLTTVIWGVQPLAMRVVLGHFGVSFTAFARSGVAAVLFGVLALCSRRRGSPGAGPTGAGSREQEAGTAGARAGESDGGVRRPTIAPVTTRPALWLLVGGISLGLSNIAWNASLNRTTVGACSVLQLSSSVVLALYGILGLSEQCSRSRAAGLGLSLCGMFIVSWNGQDLSALASSRYFQGNMLALAGGLGWSVCAIAQKLTIPGRSSVAIVAPMFALSALTCSFTSFTGPALIAPFSPLALVLLVLTGLLGLGLGNVLFARSMRIIPASIGAATLTASPLIALVSAAVALHEPSTKYLLVGAPLTCVGVAIAMLSGAPRAPAATRPAAAGYQADSPRRRAERSAVPPS